MKTPRAAQVLASLMVVALVAVVWWQSTKTTVLRRAGNPAKGLSTSPAAAPKKEISSDSAASNSTSPSGPASQPGSTSSTSNSDDSAFRRLTIQQRAQLEIRYGPFIQQLGLSDTESAAFVNLLLDRLNIQADLMASARQSGSSLQNDAEGFAAAANRAKLEIDARIAALLGPDRYSEYQGYDKDQRSQTMVGNLQKLLTSSGVPLTTAQSSELQDALTAKGTLQFGVRQVTDEVIASAETYLSSEQLAGLRQFSQKQQEVVRAKILLRDKSGTAETIPHR